MSGDSKRKVLVLTERPDEYSRDLGRLGLKLDFAPRVSGLLDKLMEVPTSGFVLEVERVMRAKRSERDHLLKVAGSFPLLRTTRKGEEQTLSYLDDPACFSKNVKVFSPRRVRCHQRVPVRLNALVSPEDDLTFTRGVRANLLDLSTSGGFVYTLEDFVGHEMIQLRILELSDPSPIQAHIRWRKPWGSLNTLPGLGVLFVDIRTGQLDEIMTKFLSQPEEQDPLKDGGAVCK